MKLALKIRVPFEDMTPALHEKLNAGLNSKIPEVYVSVEKLNFEFELDIMFDSLRSFNSFFDIDLTAKFKKKLVAIIKHCATLYSNAYDEKSKHLIYDLTHVISPLLESLTFDDFSPALPYPLEEDEDYAERLAKLFSVQDILNEINKQALAGFYNEKTSTITAFECNVPIALIISGLPYKQRRKIGPLIRRIVYNADIIRQRESETNKLIYSFNLNV